MKGNAIAMARNRTFLRPLRTNEDIKRGPVQSQKNRQLPDFAAVLVQIGAGRFRGVNKLLRFSLEADKGI